MNNLLKIAVVCLLTSISWPTVYNKEMNVNPYVPGSQFIQDQEKEQIGIQGLWWDETLWIPIHVPNDAMICRPDSTTGAINCWRIFPGSILVLPNSQKDTM